MEDYDNEIKIMKSMSHPTRLAILDILRDGEHCVCHMEAALSLRQAYISQQLMVLREAGLVEDRRDGWNIFYRVVRPEIYPVLDATRQMLGTPTPKEISAPNCTCPSCREKAGQPIRTTENA